MSGISLSLVSKWRTTCLLFCIWRLWNLAINDWIFWKLLFSPNSKSAGFLEIILCPVLSAAANKNSLIVLTPLLPALWVNSTRAWALSNPSFGILGFSLGYLGVSASWVLFKDAGTDLASFNSTFSLEYSRGSLVLDDNSAGMSQGGSANLVVNTLDFMFSVNLRTVL